VFPPPARFRRSRKAGSDLLSSPMETTELVNAIAAEMASGVDAAVECWMAQIERASSDSSLTTLGRMAAVKDVLNRYKQLTGKAELHGRRACGPMREELAS
jgi:hypothetical protein